MKRTLSLLCMAVLVACESKPALTPETGSPTPAPVVVDAGPPQKVGAPQCGHDEECHATNPCGVYGPEDCGPTSRPVGKIEHRCPNTIATHRCACVAGLCSGVKL